MGEMTGTGGLRGRSHGRSSASLDVKQTSGAGLVSDWIESLACSPALPCCSGFEGKKSGSARYLDGAWSVGNAAVLASMRKTTSPTDYILAAS